MHRAIVSRSNPSPSLSHISHRIIWDAMHLPHLGSRSSPLRAGLEPTSRGWQVDIREQ
ncbi:hypothetical protein BD309DRAFT_872086 [Dichomitus squalens]|uniref:Uncharacterized protein n=1 Tax=Dichomitus squalens TaxID=114155 RepID=A0A4Q9QAU4_9APHY|nr:uncharacterized protein DICSQDRAFT_130666 [Dichomitus squalens LYAD-421 SS1]EJF66380.1 hypothetical protein DICSQDRAFT_130666 [Dichomitus squalens LYAD-421 SS1]TBU39550.1 hypothetical protein BD309DRAFT_872086 [Dichomitus squalens]TBU64695.1 hypothetical protein BD310DRAFT_805433 [Dichomitus squalens]